MKQLTVLVPNRPGQVAAIAATLANGDRFEASLAVAADGRVTVPGFYDRVRELTSLDPMLSEDRERLGSGSRRTAFRSRGRACSPTVAARRTRPASTTTGC